MKEPTYNGLIDDHLKALSEETEEYISSEMEYYFDNTENKNKLHRIPLIENLKVDPEGSFFVTDLSLFNSDKWASSGLRSDIANNILMHSDIQFGSFLKRCLVYYMLPNRSPYGQIKSWSTTNTFAHGWIKAIENYLLIPNGLDASDKAIRSISSKMITTALDMAEHSSIKRHYEFLFYGVVFWISLSRDGYLPKSVSLNNVSLDRIDTKERRRSVAHIAFMNYKSWKPLSEDELSRLLIYALDVIEIGLPILEGIKVSLIEIDRTKKLIMSSFTDDFKKYKDIFDKKLNGEPFVKVKIWKGKTEHNGVTYHNKQLRWRRGYANALTEVKDALLILVSLITGMRVSELGQLEFDDLFYDEESDSSFINITRFKTSSDPNYFGETETISIPNLLTDVSKRYLDLRTLIGVDSRPLLFSSNAGSVTNIGKRSVQKSFFNLGTRLEIDDLHPHRMRKTIAEILIKRSEKNIDIIRMLFGHESYTMTLRYIARNPYMIGSIATLLETHYAENFVEIIFAVSNGEASGVFAEKLNVTIEARDKTKFQGKLIRMRAMEYIIYLMQTGSPIQIEQTTIGTYCVLTQPITADKMPPCIKNRAIVDIVKPDLSNCDMSCEYAVVLSKSIAAIEKNISFYELILEESISLSKSAILSIHKKIASNRSHLKNLKPKNSLKVRRKIS